MMKKIIIMLMTIALFNISLMAENVSTYLIANSASLSDVQSKLKANGFNVLATNNNVVTISNTELKATNTYLATLQVYVGSSEIRVQNPAYFGAAYLAGAYTKNKFKETISALEKALGSLHGSSEKLEAKDLSNYHFMMGMPYFDEPMIVSELNDVYKKVSNNPNILYSLTLPNGTILVGHKLSSASNNFLNILHQTKNSQILPYEALIYSNQVKIMNPKFYLALSLPQLSMSQFMKISDIPNKIEDDITNAYK